MPVNDTIKNEQAVRQLLSGMNSMQAQAGLMPGNVPNTSAPQAPPPAHPSQVSEKLKVDFMRDAQITQMVTPSAPMGSMSPQRRPTQFEQAMMMPTPPQLPSAQFGSPGMMARQQAVTSTNENLAGVQAGTGLAARGGMWAMSMPQPMVGVGLEHMGAGQQIQDMGSSLLTPVVERRKRTLELQAQSMGTVVQGGDLSALGQGLSAQAASQLSTGLDKMADSEGFQADTGGMLNRQDLQKINNLANELGMMDQSQNVEQMRDSIRKISKSVTNFMKVMEEPDLQRAMQMMGRMRELGMTMPEASEAASNARTFARMAGTTAEQVMSEGMRGAGQFQRRGLSGASGLQAGMAATGYANQAAAAMDPGQLAQLGGKQGVADAFTESAAKAGTMDAFLPGLVGVKNGQLDVDMEAVTDMMTGEISAQEMMQRSAKNMRKFGAEGMIQEFATRRRELQDKIQQQLGPQMQMMMPLMQARMLTESVPGMSMGGALKTLAGRGVIGEKQARALESAIQKPEFFEGIRQQIKVQEKEEAAARREVRERQEEEVRDQAVLFRDTRRSIGATIRGVHKGIGGAFSRIEQDFAEQQDFEERAAMSGGVGRVARGAKYDTDIQRARIRDAMKTDEGREQMFSDAFDIMQDTQKGIAAEQDLSQATSTTRKAANVFGGPLAGAAVNLVTDAFIGPRGAGITEAQRGGAFTRDIIEDQGSTVDRVLTATGFRNLSTEEVNKRSEDYQRMGKQLEKSERMSEKEIRETRKRISIKGKDKDETRDVRAVAGQAVNTYLESRMGPSILGMDLFDKEHDEEELKKKMKDAIMSEGVSEEEATRLVNQEDFMSAAIKAGEGSRSDRAEAAAQKIKDTGADLSRAEENRFEDVTRKQIEQRQESMFEGLGLDTGFFSGISDDEKSAVRDALGGRGDKGEALRKLTAARAIEKKMSRTDDKDEKRRLAKKVQALKEQASEGLSEDEFADIKRQSGALMERMGEDAVAQLGDTFGKGKMRDTEALLQTTSQWVQKNQASEAALAVRDVVGGDIFGDDFKGTGEGATADLAKALEEADPEDIEDEEVRKLVEEGKYEEAAKKTMGKADVEVGDRGNMKVSGKGGFLQEVSEGTQNVLKSLGLIAESAEESRGEGLKTPDSFEEAVPVFSEASAKLLKAAEAFDGSSSAIGIGNVVASGNPLTAGMGSIAGGIIDWFSGGEDSE